MTRRRARRVVILVFGAACCLLTIMLYASVVVQHETENKTVALEDERRLAKLFYVFQTNLLVVEPYHGLGNRLRAYASAAALAKKSGRHLIIVWIPDMHVDSRFCDLFDLDMHTVFDQPVLPALQRLDPRVMIYDYNTKGRKDEVLRDRSHSAIYVRSAYILQSETKVSESDIVGELQLLNPILSIKKRVAQAAEMILQNHVFLVGIHIRMQSDLNIDVPGIGRLPTGHAAGTSAMGSVRQQRERCHYTTFFPHMEKVMLENPHVSFLVASDTEAAIIGLRERFGNKIVSIVDEGKECQGISVRGVACLQAALVEFLTISRVSSMLILSDWSSSSELLRRFSPKGTPQMIGCRRRGGIFTREYFRDFFLENIKGFTQK